MSLLNFDVQPQSSNPTRLSEPVQSIGYNNRQSKPYDIRRIYTNQNYGKTGRIINTASYDNIGNRGVRSNSNNWFSTNNLDTSGDTDTGTGLGIFTTETTPIQLAFRGVNYNFDNTGGNGLHVTTKTNVMTDIPTIRGKITTPTNQIETINSGNKASTTKIYGKHINPKKDVLMVLISKEIDYQVKPVVPENEKNDSFKIVYYRE